MDKYCITDLQYSKPFKLIATGDESGTLTIRPFQKSIQIWNPENSKEAYINQMHKACITKIAWADCENGCMLATASYDKTVLLHTRTNSGDWICSNPIILDSSVLCIDFTPKEQGLIIGAITYFGTLYLLTINVSSNMKELKIYAKYESSNTNHSIKASLSFRPFIEQFFDIRCCAYVYGDEGVLRIIEFKNKDSKHIDEISRKEEEISKVNSVAWCPMIGANSILLIAACEKCVWCFFIDKKTGGVLNKVQIDKLMNAKKLQWEGNALIILMSNDEIQQWEADFDKMELIKVTE